MHQGQDTIGEMVFALQRESLGYTKDMDARDGGCVLDDRLIDWHIAG